MEKQEFETLVAEVVSRLEASATARAKIEAEYARMVSNGHCPVCLYIYCECDQ